MGECNLDASHEDRVVVGLVADVAGVELLKPRPCRALQEQRKVLEHKVIVRPSSPHHEPIVLEPMVGVSLAIILVHVAWSSEQLGVASRPCPGPQRLGAKVV